MGSEIPSRIAYSPSAKLFGVGCLKEDAGVLKGITPAVSSFKLIDDVDFKSELPPVLPFHHVTDRLISHP